MNIIEKLLRRFVPFKEIVNCDRDIYLVLEDFGARAGGAWRETDEADTDFESVLQNLLSG